MSKIWDSENMDNLNEIAEKIDVYSTEDEWTHQFVIIVKANSLSKINMALQHVMSDIKGETLEHSEKNDLSAATDTA